MADNLLLRHALRQSPLPLARGLFLKLAQKLVRRSQGEIRGGLDQGAIPAPHAGRGSFPCTGVLQKTEQKMSSPFCILKRLRASPHPTVEAGVDWTNVSIADVLENMEEVGTWPWAGPREAEDGMRICLCTRCPQL